MDEADEEDPAEKWTPESGRFVDPGTPRTHTEDADAERERYWTREDSCDDGNEDVRAREQKKSSA